MTGRRKRRGPGDAGPRKSDYKPGRILPPDATAAQVRRLRLVARCLGAASVVLIADCPVAAELFGDRGEFLGALAC